MLTPQIIKQKSPQHNGPLLTLQELSLTSLQLNNINCIQQFCKNLKILYLQNNNLEDMGIQPLTYIPTLKELNLAVNQIQTVPNLQRLVNLQKLNLTYNNLNDLNNIIIECQKCKTLTDIVLVGNPICQIKYFEQMIIYYIPQLQYLNNQQITDDMRQNANELKQYFNINQIVQITKQNNTQQLQTNQQLKQQIEEQANQKYQTIQFSHKLKGKGYQINNEIQEFNYTHCQFDMKLNQLDGTITFKLFVDKDFDQNLIQVSVQKEYLYLYFEYNQQQYELQHLWLEQIIPESKIISKCNDSIVFKIIVTCQKQKEIQSKYQQFQQLKISNQQIQQQNENSDSCPELL